MPKVKKEMENKSVTFYPLNIEGQNENMENGSEDFIYPLHIIKSLRFGSLTLRLNAGDNVD